MSEIWSDKDASPLEALFEARNKIQALEEIEIQQGVRILALTIENLGIIEDADRMLGGHYSRLSDAIHAIEDFASNCVDLSFTPPSGILQELLRDAIDYGESGELSRLLRAAMEAAWWGADGTLEDMPWSS